VQRLQESSVQRDDAPRLQDPQDFASRSFWIAQVLKNIKGEHAVESVVAERECMRVAHDISVPENLPVQFDAVSIFFVGRTRAYVKNKFVAVAKYHFEISSDRI
jgi:hypothetical protein